MNSYPHMCRDGHPEVGYSHEEQEMCPVCFMRAKMDALREGARERVSDIIYEVSDDSGRYQATLPKVKRDAFVEEIMTAIFGGEG
jgi:hypothetical protein